VSAPAVPARGGPGALSHAPFRIYLIGQAISLVGMWMQQVAQTWTVTKMTDSKAVFASTAVANSIPVIAFSLAGGVLADRFDRRRVLIVTQVLLALLAFVYAALVAQGFGFLRMWHVYVMALLLGAVAAFDLPAQQALVPELVPPPLIPDAIALNQSIFHGSRFIGPALAGALMAVSVPLAFVANGVSYFAVIASLLMITTQPRKMPPKSQSGWSAMVDGLRYVRQNPVLGALMGFTALTTIFIFSFLIVFAPIFMVDTLHASKGSFAMCMSGSGLGAMTGAFSLLVVKAEQRGRVILGGCILVAAFQFAIAGVSNVYVAAGAVTVLAFCVALCGGLSNTIIQITVPNELRGRVMGLYSLSFLAIMPFAALGLGFLADRIGLRETLRLMAVAYGLIASAWLVRARIWRQGQAPAQAPA
jgi:MFS family permease